jgi:phosphoserine phosphatase
VVDLDGTLVRSDLLIEAAFSELGRRPQSLLDMVLALSGGKAALKDLLSEPVGFDPGILPYDDEVLARVRSARAEGRPVYLASASHGRLVEAVADHLGLFDGWFATDETTNLAAEAKARRLVEAFGERGFDYIGNDAADLPVWSRADTAIAVRAPASVARKLVQIAPEAEFIPHRRPTWRTWAKLFRVHQYAKNALSSSPSGRARLRAVRLRPGAACGARLLAVRLRRLPAERPRGPAGGPQAPQQVQPPARERRDPAHARRPGRAAASRALGRRGALRLAGLSGSARLLFRLDHRLFARAEAQDAGGRDDARFALLAAGDRRRRGGRGRGLALADRLLPHAVRLARAHQALCRARGRLDANLPELTNRDYRKSDIGMVAALAAATGINAVTVFALYVSTDAVRALYTSPDMLWFVCPILFYWIARALMLAQRREMDDDPVLFALKDRLSHATMAGAALVMLAAV